MKKRMQKCGFEKVKRAITFDLYFWMVGSFHCIMWTNENSFIFCVSVCSFFEKFIYYFRFIFRLFLLLCIVFEGLYRIYGV